MSDLHTLKNQYTGDRLFIIGNGPSLNQTPLINLDDEYTFAMNKINKIYDDTEWRPDFYLCPWRPNRAKTRDLTFIQEHIELDIPCFVRKDMMSELRRENVYSIELFKLRYDGIPFHNRPSGGIREMNIKHLLEYWSEDPHSVVYEYHAMYMAFQLAAYMGFDEIYLLGVDLGMEYKSPHLVFDDALDPYRYERGLISYINESFQKRNFVKSFINGISLKIVENFGGNELAKRIYSKHNATSDHFAENYIEALKIRDGEEIEKEIVKSHIAANRICQKFGISVYNATVGGELEVYERVDLDEIL